MTPRTDDKNYPTDPLPAPAQGQAQAQAQAQEIPRAQETAPAASRRGFMKGLGAAASAAVVGSVPTIMLQPAEARAERRRAPRGRRNRESEALDRRIDAAQFQSEHPRPALPTNGDEGRYDDRIGNFSKTLPHNELGEVDRHAYKKLLRALSTGEKADFDRIPAGGAGKLANPRAANAFCLAGADSHTIDMPAVHAIGSARQAAEAGEVYWMAVTRDVDFDAYASDRRTLQATADLSAYADFTGPTEHGAVTPDTLFRGQTPGDLAGPFISQFLYLDVPYGNRVNPQVARTPIRHDDYMTDYESWLAVQRGQLPGSAVNLRSRERYIIRGRDLGEYVHRDYSYQAYLNATLICLGFGADALDPNPYAEAAREGAFLTFGGAAIMDLVARAGAVGLRPAWFHKWLVHRKLRPEAFGGRVHNHLNGHASYPLHSEFLNSPVLDLVFRKQGNYLLPQAFPEGSPTHPAYPAGHATIAGACATVIKAFFDEDFALPHPMIPAKSGRVLAPYKSHEALTLGGEINKLASNMALGRNMAGVHWRADGDDGLVAGENVAISLLQDHLRTVTETGGAFALTRFSGERILVTEDNVLTS